MGSSLLTIDVATARPGHSCDSVAEEDSQHMFRKLKVVDRRLSLEGNDLFLRSFNSEHIFKSASIGPDLPARQSDVCQRGRCERVDTNCWFWPRIKWTLVDFICGVKTPFGHPDQRRAETEWNGQPSGGEANTMKLL